MKKQSLDHIVHQLNTSICLLRWHTEAFLQEKTEEQSQLVNEEIEHLSRLIREIDTTNIDDFADNAVQKIEMNTFLKKTFRNFSVCNQKHTLYLLPSTESPLFFTLDVFYLEELLRVFLENALKHTPDGESVYFSWKQEDYTFAITIKNTGIGVSEEDQKHIWDPNYRIQTNKHTNGSGLGLCIALNLAKQLQCQLSCESDGTTYTAFSIRFPLSLSSDS